MAQEIRRLHLGCGLNTPEGWIHLDGSWNAWLAKRTWLRELVRALRLAPAPQFEIPWKRNIIVRDVRKPLPFSSNTMSAIYASHLLEHLYLEEAKRLLRECLRVLEPGGVLRLVVPDLRAIVLEYWGDSPFKDVPSEMQVLSPADRMNARLLLRPMGPASGSVFYRVYTALNDFHTHKWMYDADSLVAYLLGAGFVEVRQMAFRESRIVGIDAIEEAGRVLNGEGFCVEGVKPADREVTSSPGVAGRSLP